MGVEAVTLKRDGGTLADAGIVTGLVDVKRFCVLRPTASCRDRQDQTIGEGLKWLFATGTQPVRTGHVAPLATLPPQAMQAALPAYREGDKGMPKGWSEPRDTFW